MVMNDYVKRQLQERNLGFLVQDSGFQFTDTFFPYTSGEIGPYYLQTGVIQNNPSHARVALQDFASLISQGMKNTHYDLISGGETRDWIFSIPIALQILGKSHVMLYKDGKIVPENTKIKDRTIAHVADLNNEGSSPRDFWVPAIRKREGIIKNIFFYADRMEQGPKEMEKLGLSSEALVSLNSNAWDYLKREQVVLPEVYRNLAERGKTKEERDAWAVKMLRSERGLERLTELITNPKTLDKAAKILWKGYPDIELEIRSKLEPRLDSLDKNLYVSFWNSIVTSTLR